MPGHETLPSYVTIHGYIYWTQITQTSVDILIDNIK